MAVGRHRGDQKKFLTHVKIHSYAYMVESDRLCSGVYTPFSALAHDWNLTDLPSLRSHGFTCSSTSAYTEASPHLSLALLISVLPLLLRGRKTSLRWL